MRTLSGLALIVAIGLALAPCVAPASAEETAQGGPLFAFASYNAGPGNISRMRKEAVKRNLDPDKWFDNVEVVTGFSPPWTDGGLKPPTTLISRRDKLPSIQSMLWRRSTST